MSCALIYLSQDSSSSPPGTVAAPPSPFWTNPSISSSLGDQIQVGAKVTFTVTVRNHDPGASASPTNVELYWADPSLNFPVIAGHMIGAGSVAVPVQQTTPTTQDGFASIPFNYIFTSAIAANNGGHVCLLAQISFVDTIAPCPAIMFPADPVTSPQGAIHNIQLVPMAPGMRKIWYGFGASNTTGIFQRTRIVATPLDPIRDRERMVALLRDRRVERFVRHANGFARPASAGILLGRERIVIPGVLLQRRPSHYCKAQSCCKPDPCPISPRLGHTGIIRPDLIPILAESKTASIHQDLDLAPSETRQGILELEASGKLGEVHVVDIRQETIPGDDQLPAVLGGLTVVAMQPKHFC